MPYIDAKSRERFNNLVQDIYLSVDIKTAGELNYLLTQVVHAFLSKKEKECYQNYNDAIGAIEGCKLELYRRLISEYENKKILENGDV